MPREEVVIIGAGPAGVAAAVQCRRLGLRPLLIDKTGRAGGLIRNAYCVENYPGLPPLPGPDFVHLLEQHLARFDLRVYRNRLDYITQVDNHYCLETEQGMVAASGVILATGTREKKLDIPGAQELEGKTFFYDVYIPKRTGPLDRAIVLGAGEAAFDYALTLAKRGTRVQILARGAQVRAQGRLVRLVEQNPFIEVMNNREPVQLNDEKKGISVTVESPDGIVTLTARAVFAAIGRESDARKLLDDDPPETLSTPAKHLFVVGDARTGTLGQVGIAVGDGLRAAHSIARQLVEDRNTGT